LVGRIRSEPDKARRSELKRGLPCVTLSGEFAGGHKAENLVRHSGLLCLDFDAADNPCLEGHSGEWRDRLAKDSAVAMAFVSASGNGVAAVCRIDPERHTESFDALREHFRIGHGLSADKSCRDVSRLRYLSHDPGVAENPAACVFMCHLPVSPPPPARGRERPAFPCAPAPALPKERREEVLAALERVSPDDRQAWLDVGMAIHSEAPGLEGYNLWRVWSEFNDTGAKFDEQDLERVWRSFGQRSGIGMGTLFKLAYNAGWKGVPMNVVQPPVPAADGLTEAYGPPLVGSEDKPAINQMRFAAQYVRDSGVVHDPTLKRFYVYEADTGLWRHQSDDATLERLSETFAWLLTEEKFEGLLSCRSASMLKGLRELARGIAEARDVFVNRPAAIHVANGMLVIGDDGRVTLEPFGRQWYSRNRSEIRWNPGAECPRFKSELILSAMDADDAGLIQRYAGQCLLGVNRSQTFLVLRGTAGGGKSTLANVIEGVIGRHNVSELRVMQLTERFELVRFVGRTLLSGKDVPGDFLNSKPSHVIKALVGGDTLEGEAKHGNESFAVPGLFNVMISTNTRLRVKLDSDAGAWRRRMLIVDYARPKVVRPVPGFDALLLREEGEGILRWAVEGAVRLQQELRDFGVIQLTETQRRRVDDLLSESDSVRSFVRECVVACHRGEVAIQDLATAYRDYCEARDWEPLRERQFQAELPDAMLDIHRAGRRNDIRSGGKAVRGFRGVRLQPYGGGSGGSAAVASPDASDGLREVAVSEGDLFDGESSSECGFPDASDGLSKVNAYEKENSDVITSGQPSEASEPEELPF
jgi:P4 family phage/plasmid primase-like protien